MFKIIKPNLTIILAIALLLRVIWSLAVAVDPVSDSYMYRAFAWSISEGRGYAYPDGKLTAYWAVGPSAVYALAMIFFGNTAAAAVIPNIISGLLLIIFTYLVAKHHFNKKVAIVAAVLLALWPALIQFSTVYASEIHFSALIMWSLYALQSRKSQPLLQGLHWGTILALACYMRPTALPFFLLFPAIQYLSSRDIQAAAHSTIAAVLAAFILIAPWAQRNHSLLGEYVPISANFGSNLWMGNNPKSDGSYVSLPDIKFDNELEQDNYYKKTAIDYIKSNPLQYVKLSLKRIYISFSRETIGVAWNEPSLRKTIGTKGINLLKVLSSFYWIVLFLTSSGAYIYLLITRQLPIYSPLLAVSAVFFIIPVLTVGQDRYHMALNPFIAIFSAYVLSVILNKEKFLKVKNNDRFQ